MSQPPLEIGGWKNGATDRQAVHAGFNWLFVSFLSICKSSLYDRDTNTYRLWHYKNFCNILFCQLIFT